MAFEIPVVIFTYKRIDNVIRIIDVLREIEAKKVYLFSDMSKDDDSRKMIYQNREQLSKLFNWDVELIKVFREENYGVYRQIGIGACEIFQKEEQCIFIEDDNLPTKSFFFYCQQALEKYKNYQNVGLICGTNYYGETNFSNYDAYFVKALLPCGWASWSDKFLSFYDKDLSYIDKKGSKKDYIKLYSNHRLGYQQYESIKNERKRFLKTGTFISWDYHLISSIMRNNLLVLSPSKNLITNVGVDEYAIHDPKKLKNKNPMTRRFCNVPNYDYLFPMNLPDKAIVDPLYQKKCDKMILLPLSLFLKGVLVNILIKLHLKKPRY